MEENVDRFARLQDVGENSLAKNSGTMTHCTTDIGNGKFPGIPVFSDGIDGVSNFSDGVDQGAIEIKDDAAERVLEGNGHVVVDVVGPPLL